MALNETWVMRDDGTMELVSSVEVPDPEPDPLDAAIAEVEALAETPVKSNMADVVRHQQALTAATARALKVLRERRT